MGMQAPQPLFPRIKDMKFKAHSMQNMIMIKEGRTFTINSPEVYQIEDSDVYLIGGAPTGGYKIEEMLEKLKAQGMDPETLKEQFEEGKAQEEKNEEESPEDSDEVSQVEKNINLLMEKGNLNREQAEKLLKENDYDLLKALVNLND